MPAKIFVSCGQANAAERETARRIKERLTHQGFEVYVAIQAQSVEDVNSGIIRQLKNSDYYVFVDFRREALGPEADANRGSLFTHQELAIAYMSGFEHVVFFQEKGVKLEGLLRYMGANPAEFETHNQLLELIENSIRDRRWNVHYSRHLIATGPRWSSGILSYGDLIGRFLYIDIENRRSDLAAYDTVARLEFIRCRGGDKRPCPNRSHLKITGQPGFTQIIWPSNHGAFDLLVVARDQPSNVFLNNALDVTPKTPIIERSGSYALEYAVLAKEFPTLYFTIDLDLTGDLDTTTAKLGETSRGA